jgi:hypothetical protein
LLRQRAACLITLHMTPFTSWCRQK